MLVLGDRDFGERAILVAPVGEQLVQRLGVDDRA
jgi:hypothetical protein